MKIDAYTEQRDPEYFYRVYFRLRDEPECVFVLKMKYDLETEQHMMKEDSYLYNAMEGRSKKEVEGDIRKIYLRYNRIWFSYRGNRLQSERTTLEEVKKDGNCSISLELQKKLTLQNYKKEAKKLFKFYNRMQEKGYRINYVGYGCTAHSFSRDCKLVKKPEISSVEEAEELLKSVLEE